MINTSGKNQIHISIKNCNVIQNFIFKFRFALAGQTFGSYQGEAQSIIGNRRFGKPTRPEFEAPAKPESQATNKEQRFSSNLEQETRKAISSNGFGQVNKE